MSQVSNGNEQQVPEQQLQLLNDFPVPPYEAWLKATEKVLKGVPFEKKLVTRTYEGIALQPMYRQEDVAELPHVDSLPGFPPYVRSSKASGYLTKAWEVAQELPYGTAAEFNTALRADMQRGQTAVNLVLDQATLAGLDADQATADQVGHGGTSISTLDDLAQALEGIDLEQTPLLVQAGTVAFPFAMLLVALLRKQGKSPAKLNGCVGMDPLGALVYTGTLARSLVGAYDTMARFTTWAATYAPRLKTIAVQGQPYHNSGGSAVQELAFTVATGVEYIREMQVRGLTIDQIAPRMMFVFALGSNFFMEIAKLRAARLVWARVIQAFGGNADSQKLIMHTRTSFWNKTIYDPYVNMLRTTTEAFSSVMGGCNSMHIAPFDELIRMPDEFSRRIARNIHIILEQECNFAKLIDPAGGSWYIEKLTDSVARETWKLFQDVERQGGMFKALMAGSPQEQVAQVASQRAKNIAVRKDVFVGTNMYANLKEKPLEKRTIDYTALAAERAAQVSQYRAAAHAGERQAALARLSPDSPDLIETAVAAILAGATLGDITQTIRTQNSATPPQITPVRIHRGTEPFEALRTAADQYTARTGARPKVFLANMGPISQHKARADFSTGFFEVGGFEVITNNGFPTPEAAVEAARESGAPVVVICSTDATYPDLVPPLTQGIKQSTPDVTVILAGYPADQIEAHKQAGVDEFIHVRANCYQILLNLHKKIGIVS